MPLDSGYCVFGGWPTDFRSESFDFCDRSIAAMASLLDANSLYMSRRYTTADVTSNSGCIAPALSVIRDLQGSASGRVWYRMTCTAPGKAVVALIDTPVQIQRLPISLMTLILVNMMCSASGRQRQPQIRCSCERVLRLRLRLHLCLALCRLQAPSSKLPRSMLYSPLLPMHAIRLYGHDQGYEDHVRLR
jgi:hypothetical protein